MTAQSQRSAEAAATSTAAVTSVSSTLSQPDIGQTRAGWFEKAASPRFALPILLALCVAAFFVNLGGYPLYSKGEPREAVAVLDMFKGGGIRAVLLPMRAGVEIPSKPLLMHWLIALVSLLAGGVNEWTVRLPSAILATAGILCCYLYVRRLFDETAALFAALVLATNFQYLQAATGARVDMTLTFFMEIGFFEFLMIAEGLSTRRMLLYGALTAAVLAKGPVGVLLPALVAAIWIAVEGRWLLLRRIDLAKGALLIGVVAGGWYLAAILIGGAAFFDKQILVENVFTFLNRPGTSRGHSHPFYYMELVLLTGFLPWTVLLPLVFARFAGLDKFANPRTLYLVIWFAVVLMFYNFAFSKRGVYLLALYPGLAAAAGVCLAQSLRAERMPRWAQLLSTAAGGFFALAGLTGLASALILMTRPSTLARPLQMFGITAPGFIAYLSAEVASKFPIAVVLAMLLIVLGFFLVRSAADVAILALGVGAGAGCLAMVANLFVVPAIAKTLTLKDFALQTSKIVGNQRVAYFYGLNYDIAYYTNKTIPLIADLKNDPPQYLILGDDTYQGHAIPELRGYSPVLKSNPTDLDGSSAMLLVRRNPTAAAKRSFRNS